MRTYEALYRESLRRLKEAAVRNADDKAYNKQLDRTMRLHVKAILEQDRFFNPTPEARKRLGI